MLMLWAWLPKPCKPRPPGGGNIVLTAIQCQLSQKLKNAQNKNKYLILKVYVLIQSYFRHFI